MSFAESGPWRFRYVPGVDKVIAFHEQEERNKTNDEDPFAEAGVDLPNAPEADFGSALAVGFLKPMLQEARFTVTLQVGENIVETNAPAKPTPRSVHLFDADLKKFANSKKFEAAIIGKWTIEKLIREKVDGIHGLPSDKEITVKFE